MKSFMDYLCLTIDQMILRSLCCLEPMEIHNPVASSYYYTIVSVLFSPSSSLFNYLFLIITYFLRTSREVSFPFSFCLTVEPESRSRHSIIVQRVFTPTYVYLSLSSFFPSSSISLFAILFNRMLRLIFSFFSPRHPINDRTILYFTSRSAMRFSRGS